MKRESVLFLFLFTLFLSARRVEAQAGEPFRQNRLVVASPHFDEPTKMGNALYCPAAPLQLYGFEGERGVDSTATLAITVKFYRGQNLRGALDPSDQAFVRLYPWAAASKDQPIPSDSATYRALTDRLGQAQFEGRPGLYRFSVERIGLRGGEGIVQLRPGARDSIHAYMDQQALC